MDPDAEETRRIDSMEEENEWAFGNIESLDIGDGIIDNLNYPAFP
jgi:hypothetical protein